MSSDVSIKIENLSKCYHIYEQPGDRLKQFVLPPLQKIVGQKPRQHYREFWALKNISFNVEKGETVGVIGKNGSGKSTLLQMICGTLNPTAGSIQVDGRIGALLELGSGFNPEFTGRENIYLNASVLGLSKREIDQRLNQIIDFAEIGQFIDQPVKSYSSGMVVRLAFAVQSQIDPDILIVDEALSVGDAKFQAKCFDRLKQLKERGTSILLVTHSSEQIVMHCNRALLLNEGAVIEVGEPRHVVNRYLDLLFGRERNADKIKKATRKDKVNASTPTTYPLNLSEDSFSTRTGYNPGEYRWGDGAASILDFYITADGQPFPAVIETGQQVLLALSIQFMRNLVQPILGVTIKTKEGVTVYGANSETLAVESFDAIGQTGTTVIAEIKFRCQLAPGDYFVSLGLATRTGGEIIPHDRRYDSIHLQILPSPRFFGLIDLEAQLSLGKPT